jgi:hypothetical protein
MADGTSEAAVLIQKSMGKTLEEATAIRVIVRNAVRRVAPQYKVLLL